MKRGRRCVPPGPGTQEGSRPDQRAWHLHAGGVPRWLHPHLLAARPSLRPVHSPLPPSRLLPLHLSQRLLCRVAGALATQRTPGGRGGTFWGPIVQSNGPRAKVCQQPRETKRALRAACCPPFASSPRHCCTGGPSYGRASSKAGTPRRNLKVGTSRAAPWRDPVPASGTPGSARGRGPGAFCGCLGSRERQPGGEGCAHAAAVWSSPGSSRGVPGTQSALSGGAPESILTLHTGFLGSPGRRSDAGSSFTCWFTVCRHPHQWASLSHSLIMNSARVYGLSTWSVLVPWQSPGDSLMVVGLSI